MTISPGTRLGAYEVVAQLGAGGMGEVYRARDTRLKRDVALKVLIGAAAEDSGRFRRFQTEAESTAALSHPNIVAVYDIGQEDGAPFIVSELVSGGALTPLLARGPLSVRKLLDLAIPIAEGLAAAHARGIVHRDLKPDNILLTADGSPKIADFGLAKYFRPSQDAESSQLMTLTDDRTKEGTIVGTVSYMSPEQAKGETVDFRSDQFSFGSLLYEMATGTRAFRKATAVQTLAAIVQEEPEPIGKLNPTQPAPLRWIIERCLAKEPRQRYASTEDLARELATVREHIAEVSGSGEAIAVPTRRNRLVWLAAAAVAALLTVVLASGYLRRAPRPSSPISSSLILPEKMILGDLALSPDGRRLAFTADTGGVLWILTLDGTAAQPSTVGGDAAYPFWSPDGRFVAFLSDGKLKKVDSAGGMIQTICDAEAGGGGSWGSDGTILFAPTTTSALYRVSASGGQPVVVTKLDSSRQETSHRYPSFLPDGRHFLYMARGSTSPPYTIRLASLDGKVDKAVEQTNSNAAYAAGHLLYAREGTLSARPFDLGRLETTGDPVPIAQGLGMHFRFHFQFGAAERLLVFARRSTSPPSTLLWIDRSGKPGRALGKPGFFGPPRLSPDGRKVAVDVSDPARNIMDIWIYDAATGAGTKFVVGSSQYGQDPVWSPQGDRIVFFSYRKGGGTTLFVKSINGANKDVLLESADENTPEDWSPDGRFISLFTLPNQGKKTFQIWLLGLVGERKATPFATEAPNPESSRFSPDGRWIAFQSEESGKAEVYVRPFPGPGGQWQVSTAGGGSPRWRRDSKELYYRSADNKIMAVPVRLDPTFQAGSPAALFSVPPGSDYDVSADGQRFLVNSPSGEESSPPLTLLADWTALLKE